MYACVEGYAGVERPTATENTGGVRCVKKRLHSALPAAMTVDPFIAACGDLCEPAAVDKDCKRCG